VLEEERILVACGNWLLPKLDCETTCWSRLVGLAVDLELEVSPAVAEDT
jgi:hypothetical protein